MATKTIDKTFICVGDTICTPIDSVMNNSGAAVTNVVVNVDVPLGVTYNYSNLTHGTFDSINNVWNVGTLKSLEKAVGSICWTVSDDCKEPFKFLFGVTSSLGTVCIDSDTDTACILIEGVTNCVVNTYKSLKTVTSDYTVDLHDLNVFIDASANPVVITLPDPALVYNTAKQAGTEWYLKVINLDNPVTINSPDGVIVDMSTVADATNGLTFSIVGGSFYLISAGTYYAVKSI